MSESNNGFLLDLFCRTQRVSVQICRTFAIYRSLPCGMVQEVADALPLSCGASDMPLFVCIKLKKHLSSGSVV